MNKDVTISVPPALYRQAETLAKRSNRSVADVLTEAIKLPDADVTFSNGEQHEAVEREKQAYIAMHSQLLENYAGKHVAIHAGQIVDHDEDGVALKTGPGCQEDRSVDVGIIPGIIDLVGDPPCSSGTVDHEL